MTRRRLALWGPLAAALLLVFWLSSLPRIPGAALVWDKLLHTAGFTVLGGLALRAFHGGLTRPRPAPTAAAGAFHLLWSLSDEYHQSFVPGREASAGDVVADLLGFAIAWGLLYLWGTRRRAASAGA